ncbi:MAG TPA: hypothetical protein PK859_05200 [Spirochaetota bacterium]|nr:hypothetical protein [Spirochaetota bacterium]HPR49485.1 hypothetical protein [Spirochaetota bacterium]
MTDIQQNTDPRNLFLALSLVIITGGGSLFLGMKLLALLLTVIGALFYYLYVSLNFCDPYTHSDCVQNGNTAAAFFVLYLMNVAGINNFALNTAAIFLVLAALESLNMFITGATRREFPVMGLFISVIACVATLTVIYSSRISGAPSAVPALTGAASREGTVITAAVLSPVLASTALIFFMARPLLMLHSHGPAYNSYETTKNLAVKTGLIAGKALTLSIAFMLIGLFAGVAYYLLLISKSRYAIPETLILALLYPLIFTAVSPFANAWILITITLVISQALYCYQKIYLRYR